MSTNIWLKASFAAAVVAVGIGGFMMQDIIHNPQTGVDYLQSQGYTDISGGSMDFLQQCGKSTFGRNYIATNQNGQVERDATVCYGWFGPHRPLLFDL